MNARWSFGVEPLPGSDTAARLLRDIAGELVALEHDDGALAAVGEELAVIERRLAARAPADPAPRVGDVTDGRVYVDHSRDIGAFNPCFPEYAIVVEGDHARGTVTFPPAFEGPPGVVHGGFLAVFFDCVMQHHNCERGAAGKTSALNLRYRRPTPLGTELEFRIERSVSEGRIRSTAELLADGTVCCEAEMQAVAGNLGALPAVSPRRSAR